MQPDVIFPHSYSYDLAGNRTRADYGTGRSVQTSYDALNRPESIVEGTRATRYGYDLGGRAVILMAGNGQVTSNSYDTLGRLMQRTLYRTQSMTEGDVMAHFEWTHDLLGNVTTQSETWPGEVTRPGMRTTSMAYDANNRLTNETVDDPTAGVTSTAYAYDAANNRSTKQVTGGTEPGQWTYVYNAANQLTSWEKQLNGSPVKTAALTYDAAGNRIAQTISENGGAPQSTLLAWDAQDRLASVTMPDGSQHGYEYDYRTRRIATTRNESASTAIVFAGGLSLAEYETANSTPTTANGPTVEYTRGPDMGGGVGGMLYSLRGGAVKYSLSNGRGDIVAQADQAATLTWTASYEAYGKRTKETGTNQDKQRANSKDEDPTGLLNEGFRYRDIETGVWLSRDPAGFVDGPNVYAYVRQNPWTAWDPLGLSGYSDLATSAATDLAEDRYIQGNLKAVGAALWEAFSFGNASRMGEVEDSYANGDISAGQAAWDAAAGTATAVKDAALTYGTGGAVLKLANKYDKAETLVNVGTDLAKGDYAGAALGVLGEVVPGGKKSDAPGGKGAKQTTAEANAMTGGNCFPAGTLVMTTNGTEPIEDVDEGETVLAYDFETGKLVSKTVTSTVEHYTYYWVDVDIGTETITATRGHRFWVESQKDWIEALHLKPGMIVREADGDLVAVRAIAVRELDNPETTFNFEVAEEHNYFVGNSRVLVHNGYPDKPQYPPPTKPGENFQFNFDSSEDHAKSRAAGVRRAKAQGSQLPGMTVGHHINSVASHPHLAAEPDNVKFVKDQAANLNEHGGKFQNQTSGPLQQSEAQPPKRKSGGC